MGAREGANSPSKLDALDGEGYALADADTHRGQCPLGLRFLQLMNGSEDQPSAAHAEWMAKRDGSTVWIYVRCVVGQSELAQARKRLAGECFVQFDEIKIGDGKFEPREQFFDRRDGTDAHDARRNACGGHPEESRAWSESVTLHG